VNADVNESNNQNRVSNENNDDNAWVASNSSIQRQNSRFCLKSSALFAFKAVID